MYNFFLQVLLRHQNCIETVELCFMPHLLPAIANVSIVIIELYAVSV